MNKPIILGEILKDDVELSSNYFSCYLKKHDSTKNMNRIIDITNLIGHNVGDVDIYIKHDVFQGTLCEISKYVERNFLYHKDYEQIIVEDNGGAHGLIYKYGNHGQAWEIYAETGGVA